MRLVHASSYLSQFNITIHHIAGKLNIVLDALSRLPATQTTDVSTDDELGHIPADVDYI